jgi:membrane-bound metal-dependent hydrolase YbcI (DUF457 family)
MFVGHFGVAFAAKRAAPRTSLAVLLAAALFLDVVWPVLVLAGVETVRIDPGNTPFTPLDFVSYPWSHSAPMTLVWSVLFGAAVYAFTRDRAGALICGLLVASHWVLDFVSHRADLPLWWGGPRVGLGLWYSVPATLVVEGAIFVGGVWLYLATTRPRDRVGRFGFAGLVALLALAYGADRFGGPPPSVAAVAWVGVAAAVILLPCTAWVDRHRQLRDGPTGDAPPWPFQRAR